MLRILSFALFTVGCGRYATVGTLNDRTSGSAAAVSPTKKNLNTKTIVDAGMVGSSLQSATADNVGISIHVGYPNCPNLAAKVDIWYNNGSSFEFHNRCYIPSAADPASPNDGFCLLKYPIPTGTSANNFVLRVWQATENCLSYADEVGDLTGYNDFLGDSFSSNIVLSTPSYTAYTSATSRVLTIDRANYQVKMDSSGGATYEFYSKRAHDATLAGKTENMIHANMGAAMQFVLASWETHGNSGDTLLTADGCGGQGIWNPTQAGAFCGVDAAGTIYPTNSSNPSNSGMSISCDGTLNNQCTQASRTVDFSEFRLMNWDYGAQYLGSFNSGADSRPGLSSFPGDTAFMSQHVDAQDAYIAYDIKFRNNGFTRVTDVSMPIVYLNNHYRAFYYPSRDSGAVVSGILPELRSGADPTTAVVNESYMASWISMENTSAGVSGNYITVAAFRDSHLRADQTSENTIIWEGPSTHTVIPNMQLWINMQQNVTYGLRYVVFPFRYDEIVTTQYGSLTVAQTIAAMRASYEAPASPPKFQFNLAAVFSNDVLWSASAVIDDNPNSAYSSGFFASSQNDRTAFIAAWLPDSTVVNEVILQARMVSGAANGFPAFYDVYVTSSDNSRWNFVGNYSGQPDSSGSATIALGAEYSTHGVLIIPTTLGADTYGNHYFQLAEVKLATNSSHWP